MQSVPLPVPLRLAGRVPGTLDRGLVVVVGVFYPFDRLRQIFVVERSSLSPLAGHAVLLLGERRVGVQGHAHPVGRRQLLEEPLEGQCAERLRVHRQQALEAVLLEPG